MHAPIPLRKQGFTYELRDFLRFLIRPRLSPRLPKPTPAHPTTINLSLGFPPDFPLVRLFQWALALWAVNLLVMGPIALSAAKLAGVEHRMNLVAIPWLQALLWAPVVEELVFRYGLRQPAKALWILPFTIPALLMGPDIRAALLLGTALLLCHWLHRRTHHNPSAHWVPSFHWHKTWCRHFGWILHASCLAFAALHLYNFSLNHAPWWLLPLLVAPQWVTGLVLAWLRVRRNLTASITLHALFNAGPLLMLYGALKLLGDKV